MKNDTSGFGFYGLLESENLVNFQFLNKLNNGLYVINKAQTISLNV